MKTFTYKSKYIPTGKEIEDTFECFTEIEFLRKINEWNRTAALTDNVVWIYWAT